VRRAQHRRRSRGQALVEFTLIIPVFFLLLAGMIDFGIGLYRYMTIINAAREGARVASVTCITSSPACTSAVSTRITNALGGLSASSTIACATAASPNAPSAAICNAGSAKSGGNVTVTISYTYRMIWPLAFGTTIPMTSSSKFMVQ
jgi:Flp pilus assembly protein TadG